jgi:DNA-directed RNA polymerase subunit RPC12/RpoP
MRIRVICGNEDCREEFPVPSEDPEWECPSCGRKIINKRYPFLTARLMQGTIDKEATDWKALFSFLLEQTHIEIDKRKDAGSECPDLSFVDEADRLMRSDPDIDNARWKELHDGLLERARDAVLKMDRSKRN